MLESRFVARKEKPSSNQIITKQEIAYYFFNFLNTLFPMAHTTSRTLRHRRLRKKVSGTAERPRLSIHFSGRHITAQVIDDQSGITLASVNTTEKVLRQGEDVRPNVATSTKIGQLIAERGIKKNIKKVVFDRGGFNYHGKVKALADAARSGGFEF
jgi:large subunit ribosomal protein L18